MLKIGHTRAFKIQMFDSLAWMNYILLKAHYQLSHIKFYKKSLIILTVVMSIRDF